MNFLNKLLTGSLTTKTTGVTGMSGIAQNIQYFVKTILGPVLTVIGAAGVIYAIILGINYVKAETPDKRKEAQSRLIGAIIGVIIIIAGIVLCNTINWADLINMF